MPRWKGSRILALVILAAVYITAGKLGLKLAFVHQSATAVWPPSGIALAALLILGREMWPAIFVGAFVVNLTTDWHILTSLAIAAGNTVEAVSGAYLVSRFARGRDAFLRHQDIFKFAFLAGICSTALSATIGVSTLCLAGSAAWPAYGRIWTTWWLGDAVGDFVIAPFLILWAAWPRSRMQRAQVGQALLLAAVLFVLSMMVFGGWIPWRRTNYPLEFLCIPMLLVVAFRSGPPAAASTSVLLTGIALWGTLHGFGPFITGSANESLLLLQTYLGVSTIMVLAVAAVVWDHERVRRELARQAAELSRSNEDLQQFAYVASHDLQEPLRTVACFTELLAKKYSGRLDADAREYIGYITGGARRMAALVDGILLYSRVAQADGARVRVDSHRALASALANLSGAIQESEAVITHDPLPEARMHEAQLTLVFQNLLANAIKYRGQEPSRIHVSAAQNGDGWIFSVRDNGIGIQPQYRDQVFGLFKRLHGPDVAGAGIGLAVCKKIVERYGGRIWLEGEPGAGTTAYFTVPK